MIAMTAVRLDCDGVRILARLPVQASVPPGPDGAAVPPVAEESVPDLAAGRWRADHLSGAKPCLAGNGTVMCIHGVI